MRFRCPCHIIWCHARFTSLSSHLSRPWSFGVTHLAHIACCTSLAVPLAFTSQQLHTANNRDLASLWCPARPTLPSSRLFLPPSSDSNRVALVFGWVSQGNNTLQKKLKTHLLVTLNACTILDRTYQTCCSHSNSTTSLHNIAQWSGYLISVPSSQSWHNTNYNSKSGLYLIFEREPLHFMYSVKEW